MPDKPRTNPVDQSASTLAGSNGAASSRQRSVAEIEADIVASRERLVGTVDQLQVAVKRAVSPRHILEVQITRVKSFYVDEYGGVRPERVAITVGVVISFVALRRFKRRRRNK